MILFILKKNAKKVVLRPYQLLEEQELYCIYHYYLKLNVHPYAAPNISPGSRF